MLETINVGMNKAILLQAVAVLSVLIVAVLNYLAHSPLIFILSVLGLIGTFYAGKKLREQFNVPLIFIRREGLNYWGGAFGGLLGGLTAFYSSTWSLGPLNPAEFGARLSLFTIYLVLICTLFMGTVLQDVKDGYIEV